MRPGFRVRIFGAYVVVLALGALLALFVYRHGDDVRLTARTLIGRDVPALQAVAALKLNIVSQQALLAEYYVTRDRPRFRARYPSIDTACVQGLEAIAGPLGEAAPLARARAGYSAIREAAQLLDRALLARPADTKAARRALDEAARAARAIQTDLDVLSGEIEGRLAASGAAAERSVDALQWRVVSLAAAIFLASLFVGYYINRYIAEQAGRRRLALFPERNPNPVLQLDAAGMVRYANPAAIGLLRALGRDPARPQALLPDDLAERLGALRQSDALAETWEYPLADHVFECGIHWIADLAIFHAYVTDITARKRAEEELVYQAYHDALTDLPNRRLFQERIEQVLYGPGRTAARGAVLLMGMDRLKVIIDSLGHAMGDGLIQAIAARLAEVLRASAEMAGTTTLYRFEGDLFCVLLPDFGHGEVPVLLAERILESLREPFHVGGRELFTTLSIGIAVFPLDGQDGPTLLRNADTAMHRAKSAGGNALQCYTRDMNDRAAEWLALENHLRHAEELGELRLHYQPQIDVASGRVVGVEALVRWQHPQRGLLAPGVFVPLAEESGLIVPIGAWILRTACGQAKAWLDAGLDPGIVAVNVSARQFHPQDLQALVAAVLRETGLPPARLELEVTEGVAMHDLEHTISTLQALGALGVRLSVDDFGTGFSSLSYLKRFPIDKLKIDQSFVRNLSTDANDAAIVQAVIALGHSLGLKVVAEGVETAEQLARLREWGCSEYQGFLCSRPLPPEGLATFLREWGGSQGRPAQLRKI